MNNSCPSCGAIYNVAQKDIGRRIKCKKCHTPLIVTNAGLEVDQPAAPAPAPVELDDTFDTGDDAVVAPKRGRDRDRGRRYGAGGFDPSEALAKIGGVPTLLFGFGTFLVIFTIFMDRIGEAKVERRRASVDEARADHDREIKAINDNKDLKESDKSDRIKKENEQFEKDIKSLAEDVQAAQIGARKSKYWDSYFMMFGFLLVAFGSLGYLRSAQPLTLRIVAAVVLAAVLLLSFLSSGVGCAGSPFPTGKGG
jgi:predicted Zn finger-like uncharacterized protein